MLTLSKFKAQIMCYPYRIEIPYPSNFCLAFNTPLTCGRQVNKWLPNKTTPF